MSPRAQPPVEKASLDLRRLRYFLAVCDHGGFSRAAAAIGVAQPALTRQIQLLEQQVGQSLLERTGRGARPSAAGRFLLDRSRGHLEGLDDALQALRAAFGDGAGPLTLGVCPSIAPFFLDDLVAHIGARHPNIALNVIKAYSGDLKNLMQADRIDIALTYSGAAPDGFASADLFSERLVLVGGAGIFAESGPIWLAQAAQRKLILPSRIHELRALIERVAARRGVALAPDIELDSLDAVKGLLLEKSAGRSTILPFRSVQAEVEAGTLSAATFEEPDMRRTIALATRTPPRNPQAAALVGDWIVERARRLTSSAHAPKTQRNAQTSRGRRS